MLRLYQNRWSDLHWTHERRLRMLRGGLWELYGNVLAQNSADKSALHFKQLPSQSRGIQEKDWSVDVKQFQVKDFTMDPAQDLLVILELPRWQQGDRIYRAFLRTMSTGESHPLALGSRMLTHERQWLERVFYSIQTCGDTLGIMFNGRESGETEVVLWNWKTGQVLLNIVSGDINTMAFLSERHLILGVTRTSTVLGNMEPSLVVVDFIAEPSGRRGIDMLKNAFTFRFPPMADITTVLDIEVRSDPAPIWAPDPKLQVPFFAARRNRLYVITFLVRTSEDIPLALLQFVPGNTFLSLIQGAAGQNVVQFDWDTWGPEGSRMVTPPFLHSETWVCYVYGTRYVSMRVSRGHRTDHIYVYDFNQLALRWKQRQDAGNAEMNNAVADTVEQRLYCATAPTRFAAGEIFQEGVETRLGYRVKGWAIPNEGKRQSWHAMCYEDGIVLVKDEGVGVGEYRIMTV
ncbi:hypothetical protein AX15_000921 [Amanita polypyramis BW_CC]|nr:hypothetical protein AX15_000921 [Amanita polypyramis BW_CC]